jgi:hypothetical protein
MPDVSDPNVRSRPGGASARLRRYAPAALVHALPLVPLAVGHYYATVAAVLFVGLTYVKSAKLTGELRELDAYAGERDAGSRKMIGRMRAQLRFWRHLTFLPRPRAI